MSQSWEKLSIYVSEEQHNRDDRQSLANQPVQFSTEMYDFFIYRAT